LDYFFGGSGANDEHAQASGEPAVGGGRGVGLRRLRGAADADDGGRVQNRDANGHPRR
jgi:hypothetical protein